MPRKSLQGPVVPWRNDTCSSVETAEPAMPHHAAAIRLNVESKRKNASGAIPRTFRSAALAPPQGAKNNVQTTTYAQRSGGSQIRFILPSLKSGPKTHPSLRDPTHTIRLPDKICELRAKFARPDQSSLSILGSFHGLWQNLRLLSCYLFQKTPSQISPWIQSLCEMR